MPSVAESHETAVSSLTVLEAARVGGVDHRRGEPGDGPQRASAAAEQHVAAGDVGCAGRPVVHRLPEAREVVEGVGAGRPIPPAPSY